MFNVNNHCSKGLNLQDRGKEPIIFNIDNATKKNVNFRTAFWTGEHLQLTLMSIKPGGEIGLEYHEDTDQFLRIESGIALVKMGKDKNNLSYQRKADKNFAIIVPAGTWHNIINIGNIPLKVYSIYAPPHHPFGTVEHLPSKH